MIQRIQSIYLLLAALCFTFFLLFPVFKQAGEVETLIIKATKDNFMLGLSVILIVGSIVAVFLFRNRTLQLRVTSALLVLNIFLAGLVAYHFYLENQKAAMQISFGAIFPFVSLILLILSIYNINKDEKLVRSLDRLR